MRVKIKNNCTNLTPYFSLVKREIRLEDHYITVYFEVLTESTSILASGVKRSLRYRLKSRRI